MTISISRTWKPEVCIPTTHQMCDPSEEGEDELTDDQE